MATIASVHGKMEEDNINKKSKIYTVEIIPAVSPYDETQLVESIFESLYIISSLFTEASTEGTRKEKAAIA